MPRPNPLFPATAIATLDALRAAKRIDICVIKRRSGGRGASGAPVTGDFAPVGTESCRVIGSQRLAVLGPSGGRLDAVMDTWIAFDRDIPTSIRLLDRIEVNGGKFEVTALPMESIGLELQISVKGVV